MWVAGLVDGTDQLFGQIAKSYKWKSCKLLEQYGLVMAMALRDMSLVRKSK